MLLIQQKVLEMMNYQKIKCFYPLLSSPLAPQLLSLRTFAVQRCQESPDFSCFPSAPSQACSEFIKNVHEYYYYYLYNSNN